MADTLHGFGLGVASKNSRGEILDVYYPAPLATISGELASALDGVSGEIDAAATRSLATDLKAAGHAPLAAVAEKIAGADKAIFASSQADNAPPTSVGDAYLKLHLLSHRLVKPHGTDLSGIFALLPNVAWTDEGAIDLDELPERQLTARLSGKVLEVSSVDKFPKMTNYVVPAGVRIAHSALSLIHI